ncbi:uncharacterized protein LOC141585836 [Silene latifolia]|uniref:uncharacterized protein LOC141585836 n=1 Tax=Silene latifolia TaxID=37657 RepID=UPI003D77E0A1
MWSSAPRFQDCVKKVWDTGIVGTKMYRVVRKLKLLQPELKRMTRAHFSDVENQASLTDAELFHINKFWLISQAEIKDIMLNIPNDKAPGPDGYFSKIFNDTWDTVGDDTSEAIMDFLRQDLCSNKLSAILPDLISPNQGGFIQGRSIMENILICQDIIRLYGRGNVYSICLFKIDFHQAYDTIEWKFPYQMLTAMKFPEEFRQWVMQCVTIASFSLNLNDDLLLFCKRDAQSLMTMLRTFSTFSLSSGLKISKGKSNAYFNGVKSDLKADIFQVSGFVEGQLPFKYLGVPIKTTRLTAQDCKPLIKKIVSKIRGLGARKLSYAGKLVLVKAVLKTCHIYWSSMFILPKGVTAKIEAICRNYLWDRGVYYLKTPLVSWDKVCTPTKEGGLGLKKEAVWNQAAIGKLVWSISSSPDQLWVRWVNHIYVKNKAWNDYVPLEDSNWYQRNICQTKDIFAEAYQN